MSAQNIKCPNCGYAGIGKVTKKGSVLISFLLYMFVMIVGGLIYSIWRNGTKKTVCPRCGFQNVIVS